MNCAYSYNTQCGYGRYENPSLRRPHSANFNIERSHKIVRSPSYAWDRPRSRYSRSESVSPPGSWGTPPRVSPCGWYSQPPPPSWATPPPTSYSPIGGRSNAYGTPPGTLSPPMSGNSVPWGSPLGTMSSPMSGNSYYYGSPPPTLPSPIRGIPFPPGNPQRGLSPNTLTALLQVATTPGSGSNSDSANGANNNSVNNNGQNYAEPNIINHFGPVTGPGYERPSPSPPVVHEVDASMPIRTGGRRFCEIHHKLPPFWCQTCSIVFCKECCTNTHHDHVTLLLVEILEGAGSRATQVLSDAKTSMKILCDDLEEVQIASARLERKAQEASIEVMIAIDRAISGLEARQQELLKKIESARITKSASLKFRDESLRNGIVRLTKSIEKLSGVLETAANATNPLELLKTKDMTSAEIFHAVRSRHHLPPAAESWISFAGLDNDAMDAISNFGSIVLVNPGSIGDGRVNDGGKNKAEIVAETCSNMIQRRPAPRGRPIALNPYCVSVEQLMLTPGPVATFGNAGEPRDNLCRPWGLACDKDGHIIVADRSNNRIQVYNQGGILIRQFGSLGSAPGQFDRPAGITVDCRKRIVVADKDNHRIQILRIDGTFLHAFGEKGSRCGQFNYPWDVATNSECQIVVSDTRNHRVQLFSPEGIFLRKYGFETIPSMWKFFDSPRSVAFNPEGKVVATDFNNHRLIVINSNFLNAQVIDCDIGGERQMDRPQGVIVDDVGNIIVSDSRNHRIQIFDSRGNCRWRFGSFGDGPEEMDRPSGIAITPKGRIAVIDFGNNRVMLI